VNDSARSEVKRNDLYESVWTKPLPEVAAELGVTIETIRKGCGLLNVPLPKAGHWRREKTPRRKVLPKLKNDEPEILKLVRRGEKLAIDTSQIPGYRTSTGRAARVSEPHPLVARAEKFYRYPAYGPHGRLKPSSNSAPNLRVTEGLKVRALGIADRLLKRLEDLHCQVEWRGNMTVMTLGTELKISLQEEIIEVERPPSPEETQSDRLRIYFQPRKYVDEKPSGRLVITIENAWWNVKATHTWRDEPKHKLEGLLEEIAEGIVEYGRAVKEMREAEAERRRKYEEESARRQDEMRQQELEKRRREQLTKNLNDWGQSTRIRQFADELERSWQTNENRRRSDDEMIEWLKWIRLYADRIDPLRTEI